MPFAPLKIRSENVTAIKRITIFGTISYFWPNSQKTKISALWHTNGPRRSVPHQRSVWVIHRTRHSPTNSLPHLGGTLSRLARLWPCKTIRASEDTCPTQSSSSPLRQSKICHTDKWSYIADDRRNCRSGAWSISRRLLQSDRADNSLPLSLSGKSATFHQPPIRAGRRPPDSR